MNLRMLVAWCCILLNAGLLTAEDPEGSHKVHSLRIQLFLVESPDTLSEESRRQLSGPTEKVISALSKLRREDKAAIINHVDMTVLEGSESMLQIGETVPIRTGTVRLGSGREQISYKDVSIGTIIQLNSKVSDKQVLIELNFSKSTVNPIDDQDAIAQGTAQLTHQTTVRIQDGNAMAVGGMMQQLDDQSKGFLFIVAADVLDSSNVQKMKLQSYSRPPVRAGMAMSSPGGGTLPRRPSQEEIRKRMGAFAESMFARADADKDGVISKDELEKLGPRGFKGKPPITKEQYIERMTSQFESRTRSNRDRGESNNKETNSETKRAKETESGETGNK